MNIYCANCKKELEIEKDLGTEIYVFPGCACIEITIEEPPDIKLPIVEVTIPDGLT